MELCLPCLHLLAAALCALPATAVLIDKRVLEGYPDPAHKLPTLRSAGPQEEWLWEQHWSPLRPPPGHHNNGRREGNDELVASYVQYWEGLPHYPKSPLLQQAELKPYFKVNLSLHEEDPPVPTDTKLVIANHHKMGVVLTGCIGYFLQQFKVRFGLLHEMFPTWCPPRGVKVIHTIRRPVDAILSGFRYHQKQWTQEITDWGHNHLQNPPCYECDHEDHAAMFQTCSFNCTYFELLNRVDDVTGATIEAVSGRRSITSMANAMTACGATESVMHVSVELFQADAAKASACLMRFIGLNPSGKPLEALIRQVESLKKPEMHVTSGKYDNAAARAYLQGHPVWGPEFAKVDGLIEEIYRKQAQLYGCPEPKIEEAVVDADD